MWTYVVDAVSETVWNTDDPASESYQIAANWTGVLYAIQAVGSVLWATMLPRFKSMKMAYATSLILGAVGFALIPFVPNQYGQILPFVLIGCGWTAMLAMPFTFVTNALEGYGHMGAYLGLFNGTICLPQIIAALCGGSILSLIGGHASSMMIVAGVSLLVGSCCVMVIKEKKQK
jgi:maltose/moltooligosaccharide transporter